VATAFLTTQVSPADVPESETSLFRNPERLKKERQARVERGRRIQPRSGSTGKPGT